MQLFDFIRMRWPFFNQTIRSGRPNHFMLLPCDHGPGDCAFSRPLLPDKYRQHVSRSERQWREIPEEWVNLWETINPASPSRGLFFLLYSGWADQLRNPSGSCLNCFAAGLDVRLPTPEGHECGPLCGMHFVFNESASQNVWLPPELQVRKASDGFESSVIASN